MDGTFSKSYVSHSKSGITYHVRSLPAHTLLLALTYQHTCLKSQSHSTFLSLFIHFSWSLFLLLFFFSRFTWNFLAFILGNTLPWILTSFFQRSHFPSLYHDFYVWISQTDIAYSILGAGERQKDFCLWTNPPRRDMCVICAYTTV